MALKTIPFDPAEGIETAEDVADFLEAAFEEADARHMANALGIVARSKGITALAEKTGLKRQTLYQALSPQGNPSLDTLVAVMEALGLRLAAKVKEAA